MKTYYIEAKCEATVCGYVDAKTLTSAKKRAAKGDFDDVDDVHLPETGYTVLSIELCEEI